MKVLIFFLAGPGPKTTPRGPGAQTFGVTNFCPRPNSLPLMGAFRAMGCPLKDFPGRGQVFLRLTKILNFFLAGPKTTPRGPGAQTFGVASFSPRPNFWPRRHGHSLKGPQPFRTPRTRVRALPPSASRSRAQSSARPCPAVRAVDWPPEYLPRGKVHAVDCVHCATSARTRLRPSPCLSVSISQTVIGSTPA